MSVENFVCICVDNVVPCGLNINHMTEAQLTKFNKYVAKHIKKYMSEKEIEVRSYRKELKVKVSTVIPADGKWGNFRVNVKVTECKVKTAIWNVDGTRKRDENGDPVYEFLPGRMRRCDVNSTNHNIRSEVRQELRTMMELFGIDGWRVRLRRLLT